MFHALLRCAIWVRPGPAQFWHFLGNYSQRRNNRARVEPWFNAYFQMLSVAYSYAECNYYDYNVFDQIICGSMLLFDKCLEFICQIALVLCGRASAMLIRCKLDIHLTLY